MSLLRIGKRLSYLRKKVGLSLDQAGAGILSSTHLSNIENGRFYPSEDILILLARKYDVPEDYLLWYEKRDASIDQPLRELLYLIFTDLKKAKEIVDSIDQKGYISNIEQETLFIILKTCFLIKSGKSYEESFSLVKHYVTEGDISYPSYIHQSYVYLLALYYFDVRDYEKSRLYFQTLDRYDLPVRIKSIIEFNILIILHHLNKRVHVLKQAEKALKLYYENHLWEYVAETYNILIGIYWKEKDYDTALKYAKKTLELVETYNFLEIRSRVYHNVGLVYKSMKKTNEAINYFSKAIDLKKKLNINTKSSYSSILDIYSSTGDKNSFYEIYNTLEDTDIEYKFYESKLDSDLFFSNIDEFAMSLEELASNNRLQLAYLISHELSNYYFNNRKYKQASIFLKKEIEYLKKLKGDV